MDAPRDELGAVITPNESRQTTDREQVNKHVDEIVTCKLSTNLQGNALPSKFVHDDEHLQRTTVGCSVKDEIHRPHVILTLCLSANDPSFARSQTLAFRRLLLDFQALLTPKPIDAFRVDLPALTAKQAGNPAITESRKLCDELKDSFDQGWLIVLHFRLVPLCAEWLIQSSTCPTL